MLRLSALVGVTDNVNPVVELFPVNWSFTTVVPAAEAMVISVAEFCVKVIPVPSVRETWESAPVTASSCRGTLLPVLAKALSS